MSQQTSKNSAGKRANSSQNKWIGVGAVIVIVIAALFLIRLIRNQSIQVGTKVNVPPYSIPKGPWLLEQKQKAAQAHNGQAAPAAPMQNPMAPNAR